jgi:uncharacterized protein YjbI with pentapeptide repeats
MSPQIPSRKENYQAKKAFSELHTEQKQRDQEAKAEALLQVVNDSAHYVRNFYISFLLLAIYITVIVWSTTDEMLFRVSPVTLPLLNLQLPIKGFYTFAPYLFLLIHFNLLFQLHFLAKTLRQFDQQLKFLSTEAQQEHFRIRLFPFPFVQLLSANHQSRWVQGLLVLIVWLLIVILPLSVLVQLQLGFLPFHNSTILWGQRIAIAIDLGLLLAFLPMMNKLDAKRGMRIGKVVVLLCLSGVLLIFTWGLATLPGETKQYFWAGWLPSSLWSKEKGSELKLTASLFDKENSVFHRHLFLPERLLIKEQLVPHTHHKPTDIKGLELSGRDFRWINLSSTILSNTNFRGVELQNAYLFGANLQGADLRLANLQGAYLFRANLQGADLRFANLQGANLDNVNLQGADLRLANLQGASFNHANLQGVDLKFANLQGADLEGVNLQGADLDNANLQGADLRFANLRATQFISTDFSLVNLENIVVGQFRPKTYEYIREKLSETFLSQKKQEKIMVRLEQKIGKNIQIDNTSWGDNILVNTRISLEYYSRKLMYAKSEQVYLKNLSAFLSELACSDEFIAQGIILHRVDNKANDWSNSGKNCLAEKMIGTALLARKNDSTYQCTGLNHLGGYLLDKLDKAVNGVCK